MRLAFVVPVHGRHQLAEACLRQLARTCARLQEVGVDAAAFLVGDDSFFDRLASELGFGWVRAANRPLGAKWNEGVQFACVEGLADYVVPLGSDDIVDAQLFESLPAGEVVRCHRRSAVVSPDGRRLAELEIPYAGGDGVRIIPRALLERVGFRPAADERDRGIDGSMSDRLGARGTRRVRYEYRDLHALQITDFKSHGRGQRNTYEACLEFATVEHEGDVFERLGEVYPQAFIDDVSACYVEGRVAA